MPFLNADLQHMRGWRRRQGCEILFPWGLDFFYFSNFDAGIATLDSTRCHYGMSSAWLRTCMRYCNHMLCLLCCLLTLHVVRHVLIYLCSVHLPCLLQSESGSASIRGRTAASRVGG